MPEYLKKSASFVKNGSNIVHGAEGMKEFVIFLCIHSASLMRINGPVVTLNQANQLLGQASYFRLLTRIVGSHLTTRKQICLFSKLSNYSLSLLFAV